MNKITTPINEKYIDAQGILRITVLEGAEITLEKLKQDHQQGLELTGGQKCLALVDTRNSFSITPEARAYMKEDIVDPTRIATAVVSNNTVSRLIVNLFMKLNPPATPFKMFGDEKEATEWLLKQAK